MTSDPRVQVLLSTYNGARHLPAQLDSLLAQDRPVDILVRDDGSTDGTLELLRNYAAAHAPRLRVTFGKNVGFVQSFFALLQTADPDAEYLAFCDQDDVWKPDKISAAIQQLVPCPPGEPAMYSSRLQVVDEQLAGRGFSGVPGRGLSFRNAIVECPLQGCTTVLNRAARLLVQREIPAYAYSHDWWFYLIASALGTVVYDAEPRILYRNHSSNVFGADRGFVRGGTFKLRRFLRERKLRPVTRQAAEFRRIFGPLLSPTDRQDLDRFLSPRLRISDRVRYALRGHVCRQTWADHLLLKMLIVLDGL